MSEFKSIEPDVISQLCTENARLQAIVDRLPKTADGVPVTPEDLIYILHNNEVWPCKLRMWGIRPDCRASVIASECYSTREAAEAAKEQKK